MATKLSQISLRNTFSKKISTEKQAKQVNQVLGDKNMPVDKQVQVLKKIEDNKVQVAVGKTMKRVQSGTGGRVGYSIGSNMVKKAQEQVASQNEIFRKTVDDDKKDKERRDDFFSSNEQIERVKDDSGFERVINNFFWATQVDVTQGVPVEQREQAVKDFYKVGSMEEVYHLWSLEYRVQIEKLINNYAAFLEGTVHSQDMVYEKYEVIYVQSKERSETRREARRKEMNKQKKQLANNEK